MSLSFKRLCELERDEAWLARIADAAPTDAALARTRLAVRRALAARPVRAPWRPAFGAWAAAAMLLLSAGVVWHAVDVYHPSTVATMARAIGSPAAIVSADPVEGDLAALDVEMSQIEQTPQLATNSSLDDLAKAVEDLESETGHPWSS